MRDAGRLRLLFEAQIEAIDPESATLRGPTGLERVPYDAIFVMIGSIPPWQTLRAAGVRAVIEQDGDRNASVFVQGSVGSP